MKLAFSTLGCPDWSFGDIISTAKDLGYDGVEVRGIGREMFAPAAAPFLPEQLAATKERLARLELAVTCLTSFARLGEVYRIEAHMADARAYIDLAQALGTPFVRVLGDSGPTPTEVDDAFIAARLAELAVYARERNVTVLIETNGAFSKSERMLALLESAHVSDGGLAVLWDIQHPYRNYGEPAAHTFEVLGAHIRYLHVKDSLPDGQGGSRYVLPGQGDLPIRETAALLKSAGWSGVLSLEWLKRWCLSLAEPGIVFPQYIGYMKRLLED